MNKERERVTYKETEELAEEERDERTDRGEEKMSEGENEQVTDKAEAEGESKSSGYSVEQFLPALKTPQGRQRILRSHTLSNEAG